MRLEQSTMVPFAADLLPLGIVQALLEVKESADSAAYFSACQIIVDLDNADLLNDQVVVGIERETGGVFLQWAFYGVTCDFLPYATS